jgi:pyruvate ferredoxin oxidoreductase gamma subunit
LINSFASADKLVAEYKPGVITLAMDYTQQVLDHVGISAGLSVALGAAACQIANLSLEATESGARDELESLRLDPSRIEMNIALARFSYRETSALPRQKPPHTAPAKSGLRNLITPVYEGPWRGTASMAGAPNSNLRRTGNWRTWRPAIDLGVCSHCWICYLACPDGAIRLDDREEPHIDFNDCKGCLICAEECPLHCIEVVREAERWTAK